MEAYVIAAAPIHENSVNYFSAELGFYRLGYYVERYELKNIESLKVDADTPVFGGLESMMSIFPEYTGLPYYPIELQPFMYRDFEVRRIEHVKIGEFFKPLEHQHKMFSPRVMDSSFQCELAISKITKETEVIVSEPTHFISEFRVYVRNSEILDICYYKGDPCLLPDVESIRKMVSKNTRKVAAYGLDVGVLDTGQTALVEMNDFCCLGNYGLKAVEYAQCIADRWKQIWNQFEIENDKLSEQGASDNVD